MPQSGRSSSRPPRPPGSRKKNACAHKRTRKTRSPVLARQPRLQVLSGFLGILGLRLVPVPSVYPAQAVRNPGQRVINRESHNVAWSRSKKCKSREQRRVINDGTPETTTTTNATIDTYLAGKKRKRVTRWAVTIYLPRNVRNY